MPRKTTNEALPEKSELLPEQKTMLPEALTTDAGPAADEVVTLEAPVLESTDNSEPTAEPLPMLPEETEPMSMQSEALGAVSEPILQEEAADQPPAEEQPAAKTAKTRTTRKKAEQPQPVGQSGELAETPKPKTARQTFYSLDFRALDRDLSPEQEQEWNAIYASFRSRSILTGTVVGVDENTFDVTDKNGDTQRRKILSLVVIGYRVKVMIPETEIWAVGEENSRYAARSMVGAKVDYVIMNVDRENDCAIASRRMALTKRRRGFTQAGRNSRELVKCDVLVVSPKVLLANCGGYDVMFTQRDLSYTAIADLRSNYKPGMELTARMLGFTDGKLRLSVKEVNPNPFEGAEQRHPVGCRRQAVIEGKYAGGVFCRLPDDTTCLCLYSNNHFDGAFESGDVVLIYITEFNYDRKLIYGRIVSKR